MPKPTPEPPKPPPPPPAAPVWEVKIGGTVEATYSRRPAINTHPDGLVEIHGKQGEPVLLRVATTTIAITKR